MSFLYARKDNEMLYIFSDSKVTFSENDKDMLLKNISNKDIEMLKKYGILKQVIINEHICIGFAGILEHFNKLMEYVDNATQISIDSIIKKAFRIHKQYNEDTDFIILYLESNSKNIICIKDGDIQETNSCWIGSKDTFELFQEYRHNNDNIDKLKNNLKEIDAEDYFNKFIDEEAFEYAVENTTDENVGGFIFRCFEENGKFKYMESNFTSVEREQTIKVGQNIRIFDSISDGGFTFHIFQSNDICSMYIYQLEKGIRYIPYMKNKNYKHLRFPKLYNMPEEEFIKKFNIIKPAILIK